MCGGGSGGSSGAVGRFDRASRSRAQVFVPSRAEIYLLARTHRTQGNILYEGNKKYLRNNEVLRGINNWGIGIVRSDIFYNPQLIRAKGTRDGQVVPQPPPARCCAHRPPSLGQGERANAKYIATD